MSNVKTSSISMIKKFVSLFTAVVLLFAVIPLTNSSSLVVDAADATVLITKKTAETRVNELASKLAGKYFTTTGSAIYNSKCSQCYNVNVMNTSYFKTLVGGKVPTSYTLLPEHYYTQTKTITNNAWSCAGFANYVLWNIYSSSNSDNVRRVNVFTGSFNKSNLDKANLWPGDVIRVGDSHSFVYLSHNSSGVTVLDSNWNYDNKIQKHVIPYTWRKNSTMACTRAKNYTTATPNTFHYLDLNSYLNGSYRDNLSGLATADVYVNEKKSLMTFQTIIKAGNTVLHTQSKTFESKVGIYTTGPAVLAARSHNVSM